MDVAHLLIIEKFLKIHTEQGPEAACKWAAEQEAILEERESLDKRPHLKIVR